MKFFKCTDIETKQEVYVNPNMIEFYMYEKDFVQIVTSSMLMHVSLSEFENMVILGDIHEY